jgi:hypothetical protein
MELPGTFDLTEVAEKGKAACNKASEKSDTPAPDEDTGPERLFRFNFRRIVNSGIRSLFITGRV